MADWLGDFATSSIIDKKFTTIQATGAPITMVGGAVSVYKDNSTTQSTAGVTLTTDFDGVTGWHNARVDTSADAGFYSAASNFQIMLSAGTVDGISVAGYLLGEFSLQNRFSQGAVIGIPKNQPYPSFQFFMAQAADGVTGKPSLVDANFTKVYTHDNTGIFVALSGAVTEIGLGMYRIDLTAAELNADNITLVFAAVGAATRAITIATT